MMMNARRRAVGSRRGLSGGGAADFVVVGAGSSGCVMARRLAESGASVYLLEAGDWSPLRGPMSIFCRMPTALSMPMHFNQWNWKYETERSSQLAGRRVSCPRGKGFGGSSSINGMVYVRGHPMDYEAWVKAGADEWSWPNLAPYFKKMENYDGPIDDGYDDLRGRKGPLHVRVGQNVLKTPLYNAFIKAGESAGYGPPLAGDYNGFRQEGFGSMPATIFHDESHPRFGERCSAAAAYLEPFLQHQDKKQLQVIPKATASHLLFDARSNDLPHITGIECTDGRIFKANREVILCTGAISTPLLLQASGIGDAAQLSSSILHLPGVGQNLMDHLEFYLQYTTDLPISLSPWLSPMRKVHIGVDWILGRRSALAGGLGATNHFEAGAFLRSSNNVAYPDIQFHFLPVAISYDGITQPASKSGHTFQLHVGYNRSQSRGSVRLGPDNKTPIIDFNYMSHEADWHEMRRALHLAREVVSHMDLPGLLELQPGPNANENKSIDAFLQQHLESAYHPCGTAKMGALNDPMAVCDPQARVLGTKALRICDASLMPSIPNGNLNAVCIMMAEKISDSILGNTPPPTPKSALQAPQGWLDARWQSRQRLNPPASPFRI